MRWLAFCIIVLLAGQGRCIAEDFRFEASYGPHAVGFKVVQQYDASRSYRDHVDAITGDAVPGPQARPIQTLIWYPAATAGRPLVYDDYLKLGGSEDRFDLDDAQAARIAAQAARSYTILGASNEHTEHVRQLPVHATGDAPPAPGRFPLVIYAPSDGSSAFENDSLCEYLASQGYVVIASPSHGAHVRYMTDGSIVDTVENTRAQAADIGFLIGYASSLPNVDAGKVAVVAYSWGGMASTFAAVGDSRIRALVDLDGSLRYFPKVLAAAPDVTPDRIGVPLLYFADAEDPLAPGVDARPGSFVARIQHADVTSIWLHKLRHNDLSTDSLRFLSDAKREGTTVAERNDSYAWMARYTRAFLDASLKGDAEGAKFMAATPEANHVPAGTLAIMRHASVGEGASVAAFAKALADRGFDKAVDTYTAYVKAHPGFHLPDDTFEAWFSSLLDLARASDAVGLCQLWTHVSPTSVDAWTDLGAAYELAGKPGDAIASYRKILKIEPHNRIAEARIKSLSVHAKS